MAAEQTHVAWMQTRFTIDVSYNYRNVNLIEKEQQALSAIWNKCCKDDVNATTRAIVNEGNGEAAARVLMHDVASSSCARLFILRAVSASDGATLGQSDAVRVPKHVRQHGFEVARGMKCTIQPTRCVRTCRWKPGWNTHITTP